MSVALPVARAPFGGKSGPISLRIFLLVNWCWDPPPGAICQLRIFEDYFDLIRTIHDVFMHLNPAEFSSACRGLELFERTMFVFSLCMLNAEESRLIDARNRTIMS